MEPSRAVEKASNLSAQLHQPAQLLAALSAETADDHHHAISLLQAKAATLLRYNLNLARLARARLHGEPVLPLVNLLVKDGLALAKIRPLEKRLHHHIDLLLKAPASAASAAPTASAHAPHRPDPNSLVLDGDGDGDDPQSDGDDAPSAAAEKKSDAYRPPRLAQVDYEEGEDDPAAAARLEREKAALRARAVRTADVRDLIAEVQDRPDEVADSLVTNDSRQSRALRKLMREDDQRRKYEEDNFTRLIVTKKDVRRRRDIERAAETTALDGSDEFSGLMAMADRVAGKRSKPAQVPEKARPRKRKR